MQMWKIVRKKSEFLFSDCPVIKPHEVYAGQNDGLIFIHVITNK